MYEYQKSLDECSALGATCPPANALSKDATAWRWVRNPMTDQCFLPLAERNPKRLHQLNSSAQVCLSWGLSVYDTEAHGISAFQALEKTIKKARSHIGDHLAVANLVPAHGSTTPPSGQNGHFTFFSMKGVNVKSVFQLHGQIP